MEWLFIVLICIVCIAIIINIVSSKYSYFEEDHKAFFNDDIKYTNEFTEKITKKNEK